MTWPWSMISSREHSRSMSSRSCVVSSTVVPCRALRSARNVRTRSLLTTSRPTVGSSRNSSSGLWSSAAVELTAHALAEGELAHRRVDELVELQQLGALVEPVAVRAAVDLVDVAEQVERVGERQVPPQQRALPEHHADSPRERDAVARRHEPGDVHFARARHEHAGEHLDRRALARAVGADVAEHLARVDAERHVVDRVDDHAFAADASGAPPHREGLRHVLDADHDPVLR